MNEQFRMAFPVLWPSMAAASGIMLLAWWPRHRRTAAVPTATAATSAPLHRGWASALAVGLAFATSFCVIISGLPALPLRERWHWLLPIAGIGAACGLLAGIVERAAAARWFIAIVSAALAGSMLHPLPSIEQPLFLQIGVGAAALITWFCMEGSARRFRGFGTPLVLSILFAGVSIVILQGRNANISLLAASVSAALGAIALLAALLPPLSLASGATYMLSAILPAMLAIAWMYQIGKPASLAILAVTPLMLRASEILAPRAGGLLAFAIRLLATALPVAAAVALAMMDAAGEEANPYAP